MLKKALAATFATGLIVSIAGCPNLNDLIPPVSIPIPEQSATLKDLWEKAPAAGTEQAIPALPENGQYLKIPSNDEGILVDVPKDAREKTDKIETATIELESSNANSTPITALIFLAKEKPFSSKEIGELKIPSDGKATSSIKLERTLLKEEKLRLGIGLKSAGSDNKAVKINPSGKITVKPTVVIKLKLL